MNQQLLDAVRGAFGGLTVGALFALAGSPVPAPPTIGGVLGVAGVAAGWSLVTFLRSKT